MRLQNKVAIITGGASGLGASAVRIFAREGAKVLFTDLLEAEGAALASEVQKAGGTARFERHDVTSEADWQKVAAAAQSHFGGIDILVNNAGVSGSDPDRLSVATFDQQMNVNVKGVFLGLRTVLPLMQAAGKGGSIVNTSSISGIAGQNFVHMAYNAAKGAVRTMSKAAAVQFAPYNIRVNSVHPGLMPAMRTSRMSADPDVRAKMLKAIPMGRVGKVEEVANAYLFLASDDASYITGAELVVDGGFLAQ